MKKTKNNRDNINKRYKTNHRFSVLEADLIYYAQKAKDVLGEFMPQKRGDLEDNLKNKTSEQATLKDLTKTGAKECITYFIPVLGELDNYKTIKQGFEIGVDKNALYSISVFFTMAHALKNYMYFDIVRNLLEK